jgi:hypothetical protein
MTRSARQNLILATVVGLLALFLLIWGCPYLALFGHQKLCIALYVLLLLIYIAGRAHVPKRPPGEVTPRRSRDRS